MFTSRAEHRLLLREDNADTRLTPTGRELGLVDDARWAAFEARRDAVAAEQARLASITVKPADLGDDHGASWLGGALKQALPAAELLKRPGVSHDDVVAIEAVGAPALADFDAEDAEAVGAQVEIQARYAGYIDRQQAEIDKTRAHEATALPRDLDFAAVSGLSNELRGKLEDVRPATLGQASRIPGMTPAAISLLLVHLKKTGAPLAKSA